MTLAGLDAVHRISAPAGNLKICFLAITALSLEV